MDNKSSWSSCAFELEDIEIIDHKNGNEEKAEKKWHCDQCSLFFLEKGKLDEHKKKHNKKETVNCKYCDKIISVSEGNKASLVNRKCETCEYKCSKCPRRFLRHSSLVNHEKKHSSPKKKKDLCNNKKVNGVCPENGAVSKGVKRKLSEIDDSEEEIKALKKTKKILIVQKSQKKKLHSQVGTQAVSDNENPSIKSPKRLSTKEIKLEEKTNNCEDSPNKVNKRLSFKGDKQSNEKHSPVKSKLTAVNPQAVSTPPNVSSTSSENVVNYKPFSCHVCGDTFASDGALLGHIKTHGENAAKSFKCKFCGDEFDDIYKMQYHLAICPLAEDELESSLKQVLPVSKPMTFSAPPLSPRKRGRPKRLVESPSTEENESTQSPLNNRSVRKRRSVIPELNEMGQTTITSKQPRKSSNFQKSSVSGSNRVGGENVNDTLSSDITEVSKNNEPDDDRKKLHQCPFPRCDFKFTREKALLCHMRNHSDDFDDSLKCHKCDIPFEDIHALRLHINMCKGIKEEKDDDFNRAKSYDSSPNRTFQRAMKKDFVCNQCGRSYQSQEKLNSHNCQGAASNSVSVKFPCRLCGKLLHNHTMLKPHFQEHHPNNLQFQCPTCNEEFDALDNINGHMMVHVKDLFDCSVCLKRLNNRSELSRHYAEEHPKSDRKVCLICNKKFADSSGLAKHRFVHTGVRPYFCPFCFMTFNLKSSHEYHVRRHINFRPYKCQVCPQSFYNSGDLKKHSRLHTGEKPYRCDICHAQFRLKDVYNAHLTRHTDIRPYKCFQCPKAFKTKAKIRCHILIHSRIKSYVCSVCPEQYHTMSSLRGHIIKNHMSDDFTCVICKAVLGHRFDLVDHLVSHRKDLIPSTNSFSQRGLKSQNCHFVRNKTVQQKESLSNPKRRHQSQNLFVVPKKTGRKSINKKQKNTLEANVFFSNDPSNVKHDSQTNIKAENYDVLETVENVKDKIIAPPGNCDILEIVENIQEDYFTDGDDLTLRETNVIEKCLLCCQTFATQDDLLKHIYIHI